MCMKGITDALEQNTKIRISLPRLHGVCTREKKPCKAVLFVVVCSELLSVYKRSVGTVVYGPLLLIRVDRDCKGTLQHSQCPI